MSENMYYGSDKNHITAVTVTYGDRWQYLQILLQRLEEEELVRDVVVVDNASRCDIASLCSMAGFKKVQVIRHKTNLGSAGGYKTGIEAAYSLSNDFIMLYDDDVITSPGSLHKLLVSFNKLVKISLSDKLAIMAYRESQHGKLLIFNPPMLFADHHFLGLNIYNFFQRHFSTRGKQILSSTPEIAFQNRGVAYAGLLFHKSLVSLIGLPNPEFVVYYDDVEFTYRLLKNGGEIWLNTESFCVDICENYSMRTVELPFLGYLLADSDAKVFYLIRNRIFFDRHILNIRSLAVLSNMLLFLFIILIVGVFTFRIKRLKIILGAVKDGYAGKLGLHPDFPLS